jgi:hypothetical protein
MLDREGMPMNEATIDRSELIRRELDSNVVFQVTVLVTGLPELNNLLARGRPVINIEFGGLETEESEPASQD